MPLERPWTYVLWTCGSGVMIFITVNQVLVRLWARRGRKSDRMWSVPREGFSRGMGPPAAVAMCSEACAVYATGHPLSPTSIGVGSGGLSPGA
jgi:hypothetical protein